MIYTLEQYDEAYEFVTTHEGYEIVDLGNKTYEVRPIPPKPEPTVEEQNEEIRKTRESLYQTISDPLKMDYDEAFARGEACEEAKQAWLDSKDKIRQDNPYIVVEPVDSAEKTVEPVESLNATVEVK